MENEFETQMNKHGTKRVHGDQSMKSLLGKRNILVPISRHGKRLFKSEEFKKSDIDAINRQDLESI